MTALAHPGRVKETAATIAAEKWLLSWNLPPAPAAGGKDLKGQRIRVARFPDERTCFFFFPNRSLAFHQVMINAILPGLHKRGAKVVRVPLTIADYEQWQESQGEGDTPELRFRFATSPPELP